MRAVVYITKNKIWANERAFDWDSVSLDEVFGGIKKELGVDEMRVVLGNDISLVTAVKANDTLLTRENVLKLIKPWMPFEIDNECFDWKQVTIAYDEIWIQIVAVEKGLLLSLSSAVKKHGIRVDLVTTIGVLLGEKTIGREAPVVIKWLGRERLFVLAINGLVDLVVSDISEEDLMVYAVHKWGLAVNPEEITLDNGEFNLAKNVFSEKTKGEDGAILNLPILKDVITEGKPEEVKEEAIKKRSWLWIYMLILLVVTIVGAVVGVR